MNLPWYLQEPFAPTRPQDLVLWLNSSSWDGTTWRNLAPSYSNVNHGTLKNGVAIGDLIHPSGVFGAPRKFDGTDDYVNCGNDSSLNITDAITIEAWVKASVISATQSYVDKSNPRYTNIGYNLTLQYLGKLRMYWGNGSTYTNVDGNQVLEIGTWYHIIGIIQTDTATFYVNGAHDKTIAGAINFTGTDDAGLKIGATFKYNGSIDGVKIYNRALSVSEVVHNHTHSPIYYMQHGIDPLALLSQTPQEAAHVVV